MKTKLAEFAITDLDLNNVSDEDVLRIAISAEQSAINLYNRLSRVAEDPDLVTVLKHVAEEEKVHVGEFETMLIKEDAEELLAINKGFEEVNEMFNEVTITKEVRVGNVVLEKGDKVRIYL